MTKVPVDTSQLHYCIRRTVPVYFEPLVVVGSAVGSGEVSDAECRGTCSGWMDWWNGYISFGFWILVVKISKLTPLYCILVHLTYQVHGTQYILYRTGLYSHFKQTRLSEFTTHETSNPPAKPQQRP